MAGAKIDNICLGDWEVVRIFTTDETGERNLALFEPRRIPTRISIARCGAGTSQQSDLYDDLHLRRCNESTPLQFYGVSVEKSNYG